MDTKQAMGEFRQLTGITPKLDGLSSALLGKLTIDISKLDEQFEQRDKEYNAAKCTYQGKNVSMAEYSEIKWGKRAVELIEIMIS